MALSYTQYAIFKDVPGLMHAVFTRHGGVSAQPFATLNMSTGLHDDAAAVRENRRRALAALAWPAEQLVSTWQVHGADVYHARAASQPSGAQPQVDILVTDTPNLALFMRFADCTPVLVVDPVRRAVALGHAGWRGTVAGVATRAVQALAQEFGSRPAELRALVGPAIGPCCYAVGEAVIEPARALYGADPEILVAQAEGGFHFNLWEANRRQLRAAGVGQIEVAGVCTACHKADYFSHRAEAGQTGRFGVFIGLRS